MGKRRVKGFSGEVPGERSHSVRKPLGRFVAGPPVGEFRDWPRLQEKNSAARDSPLDVLREAGEALDREGELPELRELRSLQRRGVRAIGSDLHVARAL